MPTGVLHLKEVDTDEITLDGTLSVSGASTLEGATVTNSTLLWVAQRPSLTRMLST